MKYISTCDHCGHQITAFTHNLNKGIVKALRVLVDFYESRKNGAGLGELSLTTQQYNNFQKLQYFDLIRKIDGLWYPTSKGSEFIMGKIAVPTTSATMGKEILGYEHPAWQTHTKELEFLFVWQIDEISYKKRPEYGAEKTPSLF